MIKIQKEKIEEVINKGLESALLEAITNTWKSGIDEIVKDVVSQNREKIEKKYNTILSSVLNGRGFESAITDEFRHKVAKNMVSKLEGQVEQAVNIIRQDQTLRAKMVVAIEKIIEENGK